MIPYYQTQLSSIKTELEILQKKHGKTSMFRLALIVVGLYVLVKSFEFHLILGVLFAVVYIGGFYFLVKFHEKQDAELKQLKNKRSLFENEIEVLSGKPNKNYENGSKFTDGTHIFSADLDLFGKGSLFHFLNRTKTSKGAEKLSVGLLTIEDSVTSINQKQAAVSELVEKNDWANEFLASLVDIPNQIESDNKQNIEIDQVEQPELKLSGFIWWYSKLIPLVWVGAIVLSYLYFFDQMGYVIGGIFFFNFYLNGLNKKVTEPFLQQFSISSQALYSYSKASDLIANQKFESEAIHNALTDYPNLGTKAENPIASFERIVKRLEIRKNLIASIFMTLFVPFEAYETLKMKKWLEKNPKFFERILSSIGSLEYMTSIARLKFNNPSWAMPVFEDNQEEYLDLKQVGHPLIGLNEAVCNDFELNSTNLLNLITGSNMSGKSTFLRTLGINLILANQGGPVFAQKFVSKIGLIPVCYMRITDSLQQNASTFKAEIERIKLILEALDKKGRYLYLIDEMLRGTNSEDKLSGSMALLKRFVLAKAPSLVATHDLRMTEISDEFPESVKNYYFEYATQGSDLSFDYKLKPGICRSFNASLLLESIGLKLS